MKIKEIHEREVLNEGRSRGMGFAFLKKIKEEEFETVQPVSPCKDYLNDVVYGEKLHVPVSVCGLKYNPQKLFDKKSNFYLAAKVMKDKYNSTYDPKPEAKKFDDNYKNIQKLINWIEDKLGVKHSKISKATDGHYLIEGDKYWRESTYLISLYTLLIRISIDFNGKNPAKFLNEYEDSDMIWTGAKKRLFQILKGEKVEQVFDPKMGSRIHNIGILNLKLSEPKKVDFENISTDET